MLGEKQSFFHTVIPTGTVFWTNIITFKHRKAEHLHAICTALHTLGDWIGHPLLIFNFIFIFSLSHIPGFLRFCLKTAKFSSILLRDELTKLPNLWTANYLNFTICIILLTNCCNLQWQLRMATKVKIPTSAICNGLIRVYGFVEVTSIEEILEQFLNLWNTCWSTDQHNVMYRWLVHLGVTKCLLHRLKSAAEQVGVQFLKPGARDAGVEVDAFKQRIYLDWRLQTTTVQCNNTSTSVHTCIQWYY